MSSITAVVVTYNSSSVVLRMLEFLEADPQVGSIILVDNCSRDQTLELVREKFPSIHLIKNAENEGFGRANNRALARVSTPYALLINPDAIPKEGALAELLAASARYPDAAILAPLLYAEEGHLYHSNRRNVFLRESKAGKGKFVAPEGDLCADFIPAAVWLLKMEPMKRIGFFDPAFFLYYEDDDLCLRTRAAGYSIVLVKEAAAVHLRGGSSGVHTPEKEFIRQRHLMRSRIHLEEKHRGKRAAATLCASLRAPYIWRGVWHAVRFDQLKSAHYRGRLAGLAAWRDEAASDNDKRA